MLKMKMMNDNQMNDSFLADWIAGNLSDEQLKLRVSEADFEAYQKIRNSVDSSELNAPDMELHYAQIRERIHAPKRHKKSLVMKLFPYAAIAAMVVIFFGLYQLLAFSNSAKTDVGTMASITLNDNTKVTLNAKSEISYPSWFQLNRKIKLTGEAFFDVAKGRTFRVETSNGNVEVLGTQFNVNTQADFFEVICYEGRVRVSHGNQFLILKKGDAFRVAENESEAWIEKERTQPSWINRESSFRNVSFGFVVLQLENQFNYDVRFPQHLMQTKFSGTFSNDDIELALQSICLPLNLKYRINNREITMSE